MIDSLRVFFDVNKARLEIIQKDPFGEYIDWIGFV